MEHSFISWHVCSVNNHELLRRPLQPDRSRYETACSLTKEVFWILVLLSSLVFGQPSGRLPRHWPRLGCSDEYRVVSSILRETSMLMISDANCETVIAEYIRTKGVTRCPTACVVPTQASVTAADRAALEEYRSERDRQRREKAAARARLFWGVGSSVA
jgi:hypothetical protein